MEIGDTLDAEEVLDTSPGQTRQKASARRDGRGRAKGKNGKKNGNGRNGNGNRRDGELIGAGASGREAYLRRLCSAMKDLADGDFDMRLPITDDPILAEIAESFNGVAKQNSRLADEMVRVSTTVGREGHMTERASIGPIAGGWRRTVDSLNSLITDLVSPTTEIARVLTAVANGDLSQKMVLEIDGKSVQGEFLRIGTTVNTMVDQLGAFADEVTRGARSRNGRKAGRPGGSPRSGGDVEGSDGQRERDGVEPHRPGAQHRGGDDGGGEGDLSQKITVEARGETLELKNTINIMVDQLSAFASEVTRVAREVGTEGKLGGQAQVSGVAGTWKDLTDNVNAMASNLTGQIRNIADVTTAVARGDLSRKITVDVKGEILELKDTINTMVDQLGVFAEEVTRVAREVGTEGRLGGQAQVPQVAGTWKDLTDNVNFMASNLTGQVRNIADVTTAVARGDLSRKITAEAKGEILELKSTINIMVDQLSAFASEVTRVAKEVGTEGKLGGQAEVPGVGGTWKDLTDNVNAMASNLTGQVRNIAAVTTAVAKGDLSQKITVEAKGETRAAQEHHQHDGRSAQHIRIRSDARRARSRNRRTTGRPGRSAGSRRNMEGPHRQRERDGLEPHRPDQKHRRRNDRGREGRSVEKDHRGREGRNPRAEANDQHDGGSAQRIRVGSDAWRRKWAPKGSWADRRKCRASAERGRT